MNRKGRIHEIQNRVQGRNLVWFGNRVEDGEALLELRECSVLAGLVCSPEPGDGYKVMTLERESGIRVDLNTYDLDRDHSMAAETLRTRLHRLLAAPNILLCYRPSAFVSALAYSNPDSCRFFGLPHLTQRAFEYKPWIDTELHGIGLRAIPWRHYNTLDWQRIFEDVSSHDLVLRQVSGSGGAAITRARSREEVRAFCEGITDGMLSVSAFMEGAVSFSVNAVVFRDGSCHLSLPSRQVLGLVESTRRVFGFCGNDFTRLPDLLTDRHFDQMEKDIAQIGRWLVRGGYLGTFGVDFLLWGGDLYFCEINPRFTASGALSSRISREMNETDFFLEHLAAFTDLPPIDDISLKEKARAHPAPLSQILIFNRSEEHIGRAHVPVPMLPEVEIREVAPIGVSVAPEGQIFKLVFQRGVIDEEGQLFPEIRLLINRITNYLMMGTGLYAPATGHG